MDPSLLRERELFKKRALSTPAVEKRPALSSDSSASKKKKAKVEQGGSSSSKQNSDHSNGSFNLKALSGGSGYKFGVLAKIVNYMKTRHQRGDTHPLTLEEILDETQHLDIGLKQKQWLMSEALVNNPKIEVVDGKYAFKPKYNLKDKKALLRLLDKHDQRGLGGILLEDIEEGLPNAQKAIKALGDQIIFVNRPDKKKILFYNDKSCHFAVDEGGCAGLGGSSFPSDPEVMFCCCCCSVPAGFGFPFDALFREGAGILSLFVTVVICPHTPQCLNHP
ncbi:transcription initiation factor IIE subunit beta isoform X2 [Chiroxiphia lanceolata]|uniref:transcription initiation factor IIE subunit beta isoform X2 n=1 Tax=Chiroxiphia lanceolata TaxID=296741 RepID=UPI0013CF18E0|nr:transcription initiation factor IIE subunit beta isoform X2 [Chiroxiphia lanceolata]